LDLIFEFELVLALELACVVWYTFKKKTILLTIKELYDSAKNTYPKAASN